MSETSANYTTGLTAQHMLETQPLPCLLRYPHPPATILHTPETQARTFSTDPEMHATPKRQHSSAKAIQHPARPYSPTARHSVPAQQSSGKAAGAAVQKYHIYKRQHITTSTRQQTRSSIAVRRQANDRQRQRHSNTAAQSQANDRQRQRHSSTAVQRQANDRQRHRHSSIAVRRQANDRQRLVSPAPAQQRHTQNKKPGQRSTAAPGHRRSLNNAMRRPSTGTRRPERAPYLITFPSLNAVPIRAPMAR